MAGRRGQPTQTHARDGAGRGGEPARADEVDAKIVRVRQGGGARYILFNGEEGQAGEEVGVSVLLFLPIREAEVISRRRFHPALDTRFGFSYLADLLETLMIGKNEEIRAE